MALRLSLTAARRRAAFRSVQLTDQEFEDLHAADEIDELLLDALLEVERLTPGEQTRAVMQVWAALGDSVP